MFEMKVAGESLCATDAVYAGIPQGAKRDRRSSTQPERLAVAEAASTRPATRHEEEKRSGR